MIIYQFLKLLDIVEGKSPDDSCSYIRCNVQRVQLLCPGPREKDQLQHFFPIFYDKAVILLVVIQGILKKLFRYSQDMSDKVLIQTVLIKAQILNQNSCSRQYRLDSDKHMLAKQTGLTRTQVSNWFINARVRLWKPMVEEMYKEETKEQEMRGPMPQWMRMVPMVLPDGRTGYVLAMKKKLKERMDDFQSLRQTNQEKGLHWTKPTEEMIDHLIETGNSEQILQKAIQEMGRGQSSVFSYCWGCINGISGLITEV